MDISLSVIFLSLMAPLLLVVGMLVRLFLGSPIFFCQVRPGKANQHFKMVKFRTMTAGRDLEGNLLSDAIRLTRFGKILRSTSLDELPELWNVLKGDMSFVGPRPLLIEYLPLYTAEQARRHKVLPGITGWAQINGRNAINWEEKFKLDCWYVDNQSFWLDLKILVLTVKNVLVRQDITFEGQATAEKFKGSLK